MTEGTRVRIRDDCDAFPGETGVVTYERLFRPYNVMVLIDGLESAGPYGFYKHELEVLP